MADIGLNVDHAIWRAGVYWERDGLQSITLGGGLLLDGLLLFRMYHHHSFRQVAVDCGLAALFIATYCYLAVMPKSPVMRWLKARITYPRTGYVALPPSGTAASAKLLQALHPEKWLIFPMSISIAIDSPWIAAALIIVATGILWGTTKGRFPSAGIVIPGFLLSAILMPFFPIAKDHRGGYFCVAWGLVFLLGGAIQLISYLRRHPVAQA